MSDVATARTSRSRRFAVGYAVFVGVPLLGLLGVLKMGQALPSGGLAPPAASAALRITPLDLPLLLAQIIVIIAVSRLAGSALAAFGQPRVVGEMAAGIILGPSLLGAVAPGVFEALFHAESVQFLNALSQIGLMFFMFLVGLELDPAHVRERGETAVLTSHASICAPLFLGVTLSLVLFPRLAPSGVSFTGFALFVGAAMSVTAFPVLARILAERGLTRTRLGAIAITCAAVDDVSAWCILAGVVALVRKEHAGPPLWLTLGGTAVYVAFMLTVVRPLLRRLADRRQQHGGLSKDVVGAVLLLVLASAWITEQLGIHALFGAFFVGTLIPRNAGLVDGLVGRLEDVMTVLLLPLFFAYTGLRTRFEILSGTQMWIMCGLVTFTAVLGKLGGTAAAVRATGMKWRDGAILGALMNTRGLMQLVILNIGYDLGVISAGLFAMMVLMAFVTTVMTTPLVSWLVRSAVAHDAVWETEPDRATIQQTPVLSIRTVEKS